MGVAAAANKAGGSYSSADARRWTRAQRLGLQRGQSHRPDPGRVPLSSEWLVSFRSGCSGGLAGPHPQPQCEGRSLREGQDRYMVRVADICVSLLVVGRHVLLLLLPAAGPFIM